ncbi:hypothetical protein L3073_13020 [Ancylomarina sp. DW003]|nr:hypothetical protein [Ancylomarina sp. DW003]MDE5423134.1 hypothetical protein [Ancylomarina sp. DW003]
MKKLRSLLMLMFVLVGIGVQAQNTGTSPYVGSTHVYTITKGMTNSDLVWTVLDHNGDVLGTPADHFSLSANGSESISITWPKANDVTIPNYIVQVTETRNAASGHVGCPTVRRMSVTVVDNAFDVLAELVLDPDGTGGNDYEQVDCATVLNPVDDEGTANDLSDDNFGTTTRVFNVKANGLPNDVTWNFEYNITHAAEATLGNYTVTVDATKVVDASANPIVVNAGETDVRITVTYQTNESKQDADFDLLLSVLNISDENGTPEKTGTTNNSISYTINGVPATTGITTD